MSKVLIYSQEDLDLILELEKEENEQLQQENKQLKMMNKEYERQIEMKNEYLVLMVDLAYDYDGFNTIEGLKGLIDELRKYASYALDNNDKIPIYRNTNGDDFNILHEKIGE